MWPADADVAFEVADRSVDPAAVLELSVTARVLQAFRRGSRHYASVVDGYDGNAVWTTHGRQIQAAPVAGAYGYALLATADLDRDGSLELIAYELWANQNGVTVFNEASAAALYHFGCGNI